MSRFRIQALFQAILALLIILITGLVGNLGLTPTAAAEVITQTSPGTPVSGEPRLALASRPDLEIAPTQSWPPPVRVNPSGADWAATVDLAVHGNTAYALWEERRSGLWPSHPYLARSDNNGPWSDDPVQLYDGATTIVIDPNDEDTIYLGFIVSHTSPTYTSSFFVTGSNDGGQTWLPEAVLVVSDSYSPVFKLVIDDAGTLYAVWEEASEEYHSLDVYLKAMSIDPYQEYTLSGPFEVGIYNTGDACNLNWDVAAAGAGQLYLLGGGNCKPPYLNKITATTQPWSQGEGGDIPGNDDASYVALAVDETNQVYAVWENEGDYAPKEIRFAASDDGGNSWASSATIVDSIDPGEYHYPDLAIRGDGQAIIGWAETSSLDTYTLHLTETADGGQTWLPQSPISLFGSWTLAADPATGAAGVMWDGPEAAGDQVLAMFGTAGGGQHYSISGTVTKADTGNPLAEVVVSADGSLSATTQSDGRYTITNVISGTYTLTPTLASYTFDPVTSPVTVITRSVTGVDFTGVPQRYSISGQVTWTESGNPIGGVTVEARQGGTVIGSATTDNTTGAYQISNLPADQYELIASRSGYTFVSASNPDQSTIQVQVDSVKGNAEDQNFIVSEPPPFSTTPSFKKGANWLQDQIYASENNIGWNLDKSDDILNPNKSEVATTINNLHRNNPGIKTLIRLEPGAPATQSEVTASNSCDDFENWMERIDTDYDKIKNKQLSGVPELDLVFILGNEPNHHNEWRYDGQQYAKVFKCLYENWNHPEDLYAAGPGRPKTGEGLPDEELFYQQMFSGSTAINNQTDGFAIHVYGYHTGDTDGEAEFKPWLYKGLSQIRANSTKPVIITEYNSGAQENGEINPIPETWTDWFDTTYCFVKKLDIDDRVQGLLYFVDAAQPIRANTCAGTWCKVSLQAEEELPEWGIRRDAWLNAPSGQCPIGSRRIPEPLNSRSQIALSQVTNTIGVLASPIPEHLSEVGLNQTRSQFYLPEPSIGGVISGTLTRGVYHVTEDLLVPVGQTLTIESGTYLSFSPSRKLTIAGKLIAGERQPILFLSEDPKMGWGGLHFLPSSQGSRCFRCYLEYIKQGGVAVTVEAPITFKEGKIVVVPGGTAISSTVPFTLSNVMIDYVDTALHISGASTATHKATHLTLTRCQQGVVNHNQNFELDNSIIASCESPITTELSGTTVISYSLLYDYIQNVAGPGAQLIEGPGMLDGLNPSFINQPHSRILRPDSPAVNAANPQADYSAEPGFNGGRADMGAYGNTGNAPQIPPLSQMGASVLAITPEQTGQPGQTVTFTIKVKNTGTITDTYYIAIDGDRGGLGIYSRLFDYGYKGSNIVKLTPQTEITQTVWTEIPSDFNLTDDISNTIHIDVFNGDGISDEVDLIILKPVFQETNGQVVMESENFTGQSNQNEKTWIIETSLSGYVGSGYVNALPDTDFLFTTAFTQSSPSLQYHINFSTTGTYYVWARGYAPNGAGDSLYIGIDDQLPKTLTGFAPRSWTWSNNNLQGPATIEVTQPGSHNLYLWQREDGLRLDRIVLTTDSNYNPSGNGPSESELR